MRCGNGVVNVYYGIDGSVMASEQLYGPDLAPEHACAKKPEVNRASGDTFVARGSHVRLQCRPFVLDMRARTESLNSVRGVAD